jgi:hypothetical protein
MRPDQPQDQIAAFDGSREQASAVDSPTERGLLLLVPVALRRIQFLK